MYDYRGYYGHSTAIKECERQITDIVDRDTALKVLHFYGHGGVEPDALTLKIIKSVRAAPVDQRQFLGVFNRGIVAATAVMEDNPEGILILKKIAGKNKK